MDIARTAETHLTFAGIEYRVNQKGPTAQTPHIVPHIGRLRGSQVNIWAEEVSSHSVTDHIGCYKSAGLDGGTQHF